MRQKFRNTIAFASAVTLLSSASPVLAHPGGTDDKGGHVCRTNCEQYGLKDGQYHIHPKVQFNNETVAFGDADGLPTILNDTTLVPLRSIFDRLGATVVWEDSTKTITATKGSKRVVLRIGSEEATIDGKTTTLVLAPQIMGGRTMVPLRFVSEALGADVTFNSATNVISIATVPVTQPTPGTPQTPSSSSPTSPEKKVVNTAAELKQYLSSNFSTLETSIGPTSFSFDVSESFTTLMNYDYWVKVKYNFSFFFDVSYSNKITSSQRAKVKQELKDFQEKIGRAAIEAMPGKKLTGNYYDSWYKYPTIREGFTARRYFTWTNYNESFGSTYENTTAGEFQWSPLIDDEL